MFKISSFIIFGSHFLFLFLFILDACKYGRCEDQDDAVVVTAAPIKLTNFAIRPANSRQKRQFGNGLSYEYLEAPTCFTQGGLLGRCITFDQCYLYAKMPSSQSYYETLMMSMQNACGFMTPAGKQEAGMCCSDFGYMSSHELPVMPAYGNDIDQPTASAAVNSEELAPLANWPPPVPTHPPDHTAATHPPTVQWPPPLPTHPTRPPASGSPAPPPPKPIYPASTKPTTWKPFTKPTTSKPWSTKPTTAKPQRPPATSMKPTWPPSTAKPVWTRPPVTYPTTSEAEELPFNFAECGIKNGNQDQERIVGGHDAELGEWPWMAAIMTSGKLFCGGSLIDDTHILTAAHCVAHMNPWDVARLRINLGDYNIKSKGDIQHVERKVKKVVRHRGFDPQTLYNDIALLTLDSPVAFSKNVRPICLSQAKIAYSGRMATVIGWGSLREMGPTPGILQEVNIPIWTNQECRSKYGPAAPGGIVESFLCAGKASRDSCSGDSGGPLMINEGKKWQQVGIVSWGIGCGKGQFPGVYTRISSYMHWISKNLYV